MANILVTGGAGYIGAHVVRQLQAAGNNVVVIDNLSTGRRENLASSVKLIEADFGNPVVLKNALEGHGIESVIHLAASIEVGESMEKPIAYLENNTIKTHTLIKTMLDSRINKLIFSSTAAVYGHQEQVPIPETAPVGPVDAYGYSKMLSEQLINHYARYAGLQGIIFRFFNACGTDYDKQIYSAHESHLIPYVMDVVSGRRPELVVFGTDYPTKDGTGVRDYVHVLDIARAHVAGLGYFGRHPHVSVFNIGTGHGHSVLDIVEATRQVTGHPLPVQTGPRRPGDAPITVADNARIKRELGFELKHSDLRNILETSWR
jgi:UDP-glucose-4-epimerase GalE